MPNAPTVIGSVLIGFGDGNVIQGMIRESLNLEPTAEIEYGKDEDNNDAYAIVSNLGNRISIAGKLSGVVTFKKGDTIAIDEVNYVIEQAVTSHTSSFTRFNLIVYVANAMSIAVPTHANEPES
jgi:hypothetical protein